MSYEIQIKNVSNYLLKKKIQLPTKTHMFHIQFRLENLRIFRVYCGKRKSYVAGYKW